MDDKLYFHYVEGIYGDRIEIAIELIDFPNERKLLNIIKTYHLGFDASSTRENEARALKDYQDNIRYGWNNPHYRLKPYIGDILKDIIETSHVKKENIVYSAENVFIHKTYDEKTAKEKFERLLEEI